jgi:DNA polymerase
MGPNKFQDTLAIGAMGPPVIIEEQEATKIVYAYRAVNAPIPQFWKKADLALQAMYTGESMELCPGSVTMKNVLTLPNGMALQFPGLKVTLDEQERPQFEYWNGKYMTKIYGGKLVENLTQANARIVLFWQMMAIERYIRPFGGRVVLNVHDEIIFLLPDDEHLPERFKHCEGLMRTAPDWCKTLPLDCEGGYAREYSK